MNKRGFVLFTSLLYMSLITLLYLTNLEMYASQIKLNTSLKHSYSAQIMSKMAIEKIKFMNQNEIEKENNSEKDDSNKQETAEDKDTINEEKYQEGSWLVTFNQGNVNIQLKNGRYTTEVFLNENAHTYTY